MRIDKYLADQGMGTRNEIKKALKEGLVRVNGEIITKAGTHVSEDDTVMWDGMEISYQKYVYFMLNKPAGYISATSGTVPIVMDLITEPYKDMFPCGRLDKDTEGLLLITNDGPLAHDLLSPKKHVEKEYYVETEKSIRQEDLDLFAKGIMIDNNETCKPAKGTLINETSCYLVITEGKFHEIKRMFEATGNKVTYLTRLRMKNLILDEALDLGEYRPLTEEEILDLKGQAG